METTQLTVNAAIATDIQSVWEAWTQPKHITGWNFASDDWCCPNAENDLRTGGKYTARMEAKDGSFGFDFEAVYDEVLTHQKIVYTMADGRKSTTVFKSRGNTTEVSTTFDAETSNPIDMQQQGWQAILNNFKKYVEHNAQP
ncbi:SRPBCC family protein [Crocinitomicaceae bacterium CZZ-1]|uniref:SRPBCC family protein n=1 Tax=Taishania pollutisoli TaxID=2766479 RepID=A0A8J6PLD9_9FLAO|nr:SRPBCC family protein [Taishania pollutisoli]MBC9812930.1 SRPBCC family protein [Taishania pollutisoli]